MGKQTYKSDIKLGDKYRHETTGLVGSAESVRPLLQERM